MATPMATHSRFTRWLTTCSSVALAALAWPGLARAEVVWSATFESGDLSEWMPGINGENGTRQNVEVLGEEVYSGAYAGKVTLHPDDTFTFNQNRVDIQHQSTLTNEGDEMWLSGHYMMPEDAKVRNQIGFFESNESFQNVMDFWVQPKEGGGTTINFGVGFLGETEVWSADFTPGEWHQIAIHVLWSTDPQVGSVDVWFDGEQVVTAYKAKTKADGNTLFYQTGLHRRDVAEFTEVIYFDDFIEADTFADAKIMAPTSGGGGGGGGAGGVAGAGGGGAGGSSAGGAGGVGGVGAAGSAGAPMGGAPVGGAGGSPSGTAGAPAVPAGSSADEGGCALSQRQQSGNDAGVAILALLGLIGARRRFRKNP